jgi:hypothetical protein
MKMSDNREKDIRCWLDVNPRLRDEILTDQSAEQYVREYFAEHSDILELYLSLLIPFLKVDLLSSVNLVRRRRKIGAILT